MPLVPAKLKRKKKFFNYDLLFPCKSLSYQIWKIKVSLFIIYKCDFEEKCITTNMPLWKVNPVISSYNVFLKVHENVSEPQSRAEKNLFEIQEVWS